MKLSRLLFQGSFVLQRTFGDTAVLSQPEVVKDGPRSLIVRCRVESATVPFPSVILKQIKTEPARGFADWASLAFLSSRLETQAFAPRFHGGDLANRLFLMEDLGEGSTLHDLLMGLDPAAIPPALTTLAAQMGRMQAATFGQEDRFDALRQALPEAEKQGRHEEAQVWIGKRDKLEAWAQALGCEVPSGFASCLQTIADVYQQADGFLTFTQGDPAPRNNHFSQGQVRLLDFEYGDFRHALYDITAWHILCPLPAENVREMTRIFREELAKTCPAAQDEARFARDWAYLCAYRALAILTWIPPTILAQNRPWAENWTMREAVLVSTSRLVETTAPFPELAAVTALAECFGQAMLHLWPEFQDAEDGLPRWSAREHA